jgi:hypothetical protein
MISRRSISDVPHLAAMSQRCWRRSSRQLSTKSRPPSTTFVAAEISDVTVVGTVPEARRRGYGAALTWRATLAEPELPALLLATDEGRAVYEGMGYISLFRFTVWSRERPGT